MVRRKTRCSPQACPVHIRKNCDLSRRFVCKHIARPFAREYWRQSGFIVTTSGHNNSARIQQVNHRQKGSGYSIFEHLNDRASNDIICRGCWNNFISNSGCICQWPVILFSARQADKMCNAISPSSWAYTSLKFYRVLKKQGRVAYLPCVLIMFP